MLFARANGFALHKKAKHSRPDKVSVCKICDARTADVDWLTRENDGASGFAYQVEDRKNCGSTTLENESANRASGERARSTYSDY